MVESHANVLLGQCDINPGWPWGNCTDQVPKDKNSEGKITEHMRKQIRASQQIQQLQKYSHKNCGYCNDQKQNVKEMFNILKKIKVREAKVGLKNKTLQRQQQQQKQRLD